MLTYHSIDRSGSAISVSPDDFRRHMRLLCERGSKVVPLGAILDPGMDDAVALTFDDAFVNFETVALPVLVDYRLPATLFVVSRQVGGTNAWPSAGPASGRLPVLPLLDWAGIARAAQAGIEIGAHSQTHPFLTRVSGDTLGREIAGSCADIEREVGVKPLSFCYPYGDVNLAVHAEAASAYAVAVTTELREVREERDFPHLIPRIDMYYFREPGELEEWGTPRFIRRLRLRKAGRQLRRGFATISSAWRS